MALFAADGKVIDRDALRSIQFNGQGMTVPRSRINADGTKTVDVIGEGGRTAGHHTHHGDGRVDTTVLAQPATISTGVS